MEGYDERMWERETERGKGGEGHKREIEVEREKNVEGGRTKEIHFDRKMRKEAKWRK